jgi:hypothetical protein
MDYLIVIASSIVFFILLLVPFSLFLGFSMIMLSPLARDYEKRIFNRGANLFCGSLMILSVILTGEQIFLWWSRLN